MGAAGSSSWDPLSACLGNSAATSPDEGHERGVPFSRQEDLRGAGPRPDLGEVEDVLVQEAIFLSMMEHTEGGGGDDPELQEALHQSCLSASGHLASPMEPESETAMRLQALLDTLGLQRMDVGSTNISEGGAMLSNQCFYLAIARSWLADAAQQGGGMLVRDSALQLKREIESCVLAVQGDGQNELGDETEAYTDYLSCAVRGEGPAAGSAVTDLAIAVFASGFGGLEAYEGKGYALLPREQQAANLALVWHRSGHFEAIVASGGGGKIDMTLNELIRIAEQQQVTTAVIRA
ncbi:unnamed protein product [Polarella glacialis]|uniref:Uncharacterized protein n=1 Tax=Polarella glacialis TaxID=89957 RepID=A0A813G4C0_POLGL|nr:unnamed protein product [Polarella glacialis]CAE8621003.1 unnamed protein product [Polarella glacialis]CAE8697652.1 unnamed protein product [Polarella glacialis]